MKNDLTFIQCGRATIRATVSIITAEFAETMKKQDWICKPCEESVHTEEEMETKWWRCRLKERERDREINYPSLKTKTLTGNGFYTKMHLILAQPVNQTSESSLHYIILAQWVHMLQASNDAAPLVIFPGALLWTLHRIH